MSLEAESWDPSDWGVDECVAYFPDPSSCSETCHDQASCVEGACVCHDFYHGDGTTCVALVNECTTDAHTCDDNSFCVDTTSAYSCICNDGYTGDGFTCSILCNDGFEVDIENESCVNINECQSDPCGAHSHCIDTEGAYTCNCHDGYANNDENNYACVDINECIDEWYIEMYNSTCESWQSCHNTDGWYSCVNTCDSNPCHENASCTNTNEGYACNCITGYIGNGMDHCVCKYITLFLILYVLTDVNCYITRIHIDILYLK